MAPPPTPAQQNRRKFAALDELDFNLFDFIPSLLH